MGFQRNVKMMVSIAEDIEDVAQPGPGEELLIQSDFKPGTKVLPG